MNVPPVAAVQTQYVYRLPDLGDVHLGTLVDGQTLVYDAASGKWINGSSGGGGGGNPFDQDLNTTDAPQFGGLGIGVAGVAGQLTFAEGPNAIVWAEETDNIRLSADEQGVVVTGGGLTISGDGTVLWLGGPSITADGYDLILNSALTLDGDGNGTLVGGLTAAGFTGPSLSRDGGDLTLSTTTSGNITLGSAGDVAVYAGGDPAYSNVKLEASSGNVDIQAVYGSASLAARTYPGLVQRGAIEVGDAVTLSTNNGIHSLILGEDGVATFSGSVSAGGGVIFPSSDPLIANAWWNNSGVLTLSVGP